MKYTNALINSTSPYLLQHAHNPVDWQPWSEEAVKKAQQEDKLILVSIGYAACHWCHVMEHESFEDTTVANIMNKHFVCLKIDREERPDIDHYYMTAVQLMQQRGGWPLNVIALPDGRPIWGGTYFPKDNWIKNIEAVAGFYKNNPQKAEEYAVRLQNGIEQVSLNLELDSVVAASRQLIEHGVEGWKQQWDFENGGNVGAPKFPMPVNLEFLLYYGFINGDEKALEFVKFTLQKMARGGIYDQIGGGFSRYAVDEKWKVPHFEKMLYDNGQLLSIYAKAYQQFNEHEFKRVVYETVNFIKREQMDEIGALYSSLDADSEGEEGKFYVWKVEDLKQILGQEFELFKAYFNVNGLGFWEQGNYILLRNGYDEHFADKHHLSLEQLYSKVEDWKLTLNTARNKRVRPGLDDKTLTSWNALVIQGLLDAYKAFNDFELLELAQKNADFIVKHQLGNDGKLYHSWKQGQSSIDGFLEDYALCIQAFISLFELGGNEKYLKLAVKMNAYCLEHFYDEETALFYFAEENKQSFVSNHFQKEDNVLPSSNSVMANNLHRLYLIMGRPAYLVYLKKMLHHITPHFVNYPMAYANWGTLMLKLNAPFYEIVVAGAKANQLSNELQNSYQPNVLWGIAKSHSEIPMLKNRYQAGKDLIYVCQEGACLLPVETAKEALDLISNDE